MYLPTEGLFAEAVNITGLLEELQRKYRVCVAGPTTLAALLNSLQVGFRTLAIEKRTGEVWRIIAGVKQDFTVFAALLDKTRKKLQEASGHIEAAERRSRVINKKLYQAENFENDFDEPQENNETDARAIHRAKGFKRVHKSCSHKKQPQINNLIKSLWRYASDITIT